MQTIVDVNSVEKSYGLTQVINHCSFKIYEGEIYGLLGINGAGNIGSVIENPTFYEHLNAGELLSMHLSYMQKKADISGVLHLVVLENADKKRISEYSLEGVSILLSSHMSGEARHTADRIGILSDDYIKQEFWHLQLI